MKSAAASAQQAAERLEKAGVRPSYQRLRIYQYLLANPVHPTVDAIYSALAGEIPTLSRTTVYNTLGLLAGKGLVSTITIEENENRYDADVSVHGHFKCDTCGRVSDFDLDQRGLKPKGLAGFDIRYRHIYFRGFCDRCATRS
jgi:Fur family peroxide stress response transcriptional regulator